MIPILVKSTPNFGWLYPSLMLKSPPCLPVKSQVQILNFSVERSTPKQPRSNSTWIDHYLSILSFGFSPKKWVIHWSSSIFCWGLPFTKKWVKTLRVSKPAGVERAGAELPSSISFQPGAEVADGKHPMDLPSGKHTKTYGKSPFFSHIFVWGSCFWFWIPPPPPAPPPPTPPPPPPSTSHHCHTQLCHTPSFTQLCHTPSFTHIIVTTLSHTIFHTHNFVTLALGHMHRGTLRGRRGIWWHPAALCVAGVALGDIHLRFAWRAWHLWHWAGCGGALGLGLVAGDAAVLCVAGVALEDIHLLFAWQAWHLATSTFVVRGRRGRRGTWRHLLSFFVALGLVAGDAAALCVAGVALRGRRGTWWQSVALGDIQRHFAWQTWHLWHCARGTWWQGVALGDIQRHFAWQAWHLATSTFVLNGRRGAWWHLLSFSVADVALMALRAWHLVTRRGTWWHPAALCVAGVALGDIHLRFAWQAWHLATSTFVLRGKRHPPSFCVASVALGDIYFRFAWQAWHLWHWASSGGALGLGLVAGDAAALCVAGVALGDIQRNFAWQAWHLATSTKAMSVSFCAVTAVSDMLWYLCTASWDPAHCSFATQHLSHTALSHRFVTHHLSHTTFTHTIFHTKLCHIHHFLCRTPSFTYHFVTHNSSHTTCFTFRSSATSFVFPSRPRYNICCSLLEEVDLWGYPVL